MGLEGGLRECFIAIAQYKMSQSPARIQAGVQEGELMSQSLEGQSQLRGMGSSSIFVEQSGHEPPAAWGEAGSGPSGLIYACMDLSDPGQPRIRTSEFSCWQGSV